MQNACFKIHNSLHILFTVYKEFKVSQFPAS